MILIWDMLKHAICGVLFGWMQVRGSPTHATGFPLFDFKYPLCVVRSVSLPGTAGPMKVGFVFGPRNSDLLHWLSSYPPKEQRIYLGKWVSVWK